MTDPATPTPSTSAYSGSDEGKVPAFIVYALYIAGVFSAHLISPIGVIVAYVSRGSASPWVRTHLDQQIKMFWTVFWWMVGLGLLAIVLALPTLGLSLVLAAIIGGIVFLIFTIWFAVKSLLGLLRLINGKPA